MRGKLLVTIQSLCEDGWARLRFDARLEVWSHLGLRSRKVSGRQAGPLPPLLFNIFIDRIVTETRKHFYGRVPLA